MEKESNKEVIKGIIDDIIDATFKVIKKVYDSQKEALENFCPMAESLIIFPKYRNGTDRISEQELRFIFIEQFYKRRFKSLKEEKDWPNLYYSVEVPSTKGYIFSKDGYKVFENPKEGVSARTDLVIYTKKGNQVIREALIEFKALNPGNANYQKDFFKLENEDKDDTLKYFIQIIKNCDNDTIDSLKGKTARKTPDTIYRCWCLENGKEITNSIINK